MFAAHVPTSLRHGHNRQVLAYLGQRTCQPELDEAVHTLVQSTGLGTRAHAEGWANPWAAWHLNGAIFAYACGEHEVGYLVETTDSDHPAGQHWEMQSLYDPSENLDRNLKNALCLVWWD